jgi:hypothetical protein
MVSREMPLFLSPLVGLPCRNGYTPTSHEGGLPGNLQNQYQAESDEEEKQGKDVTTI